MKIKHVALTHVGAVRSENQDSIFTLPDHGVFLVADGMGGEKAGAEASQQVVATVSRIAREFFSRVEPEDPSLLIKMAQRSLEIASQEVFQISVREPDKAGLGSTGSLLLLHRGAYFIAQVGDSRIYLVRNGKVTQVTRDHTVVWTLYESGIITRDQIETHPERHLLTQCIGGAKPVEVEVFADRVQEGDVFLICSDGLTGYAGETEVIKTLIDPIYTIEECAQKMLRAALLGGGGDNVSIVLAQIEKLDPGDDWAPKVGEKPKTVPPTRREDLIKPMAGAAGAPAKSRSGLIAALAVLALLLLVGLILLQKGKADVAERESSGRRDRRGADVPVAREPSAPAPVTARTLVSFDAPASGIRSITIVERPDEDGPVVYVYPNPEESAPKMQHELKPRTLYQITINDMEGRVISHSIELAQGQNEHLNLEPE